jgi:predicted TPR repeat methyltransferase
MAKRGKPSHAVDHIERVLRDNGLALVRCEQVQLRLENGEPVAGSLVVAARA